MSDDFNVVVRAMAEQYKELEAEVRRLRAERDGLQQVIDLHEIHAAALRAERDEVTIQRDEQLRLHQGNSRQYTELLELQRAGADEIIRLRADLALMTQERDAISSVFDAYKGDCDALRAERDQASAALTRYTDVHDLTADAYKAKYGVSAFSDAMDDFYREARAALAGNSDA